MVWYSHLFKNFPQFVVIYTVKGFNIVNEAEEDVFLEFSFVFYEPMDVGNLISGSNVHACVLSHVLLLVTPWTVVHQLLCIGICL